MAVWSVTSKSCEAARGPLAKSPLVRAVLSKLLQQNIHTSQHLDSVLFIVAMAEKRPAPEGFGSSQMVVKRPNLGKPGSDSAVPNGSAGALIQAV